MTMETQRMRTFVGIGALALLAALPMRAAAEVFVDARAGGMGWGLGYGFDVGVNTSDNTSVRFNFAYADRDWDHTYDNVVYRGDYKLRSYSGLVDWRPMSGVFHLTFGILYADKNDLDLSVTDSIDFNSGTYTTTLKGRLEYDRNWGPYAGVGWGNMGKKDKGFLWTADLGVAFLGAVSVHLTSTTTPPFDSDLRAKEQEIQDDLRFLRWIPMIGAAVGWRF
jgi:hypothetical protein